jgi:hypothetical protein
MKVGFSVSEFPDTLVSVVSRLGGIGKADFQEINPAEINFSWSAVSSPPF